MKTLVLLAALLTFSPLALADEPGSSTPAQDWLLILSTQEVAEGPAEFYVLQERYRPHLNMFDYNTVVSAEISAYTYRYAGVTTCASDDPRLVHLAIAFRVCDNAGDVDRCSNGVTSLPTAGDPCL